jgi:NADH-quinone oxidoreductase subunit L
MGGHVPLILLAIPSILIGFFTVGPMLFGTDMLGHAKQLPYFLGSIDVAPAHDVIGKLAEEFHGPGRGSRCTGSRRRRSGWPSRASCWPTIMYWWKPDLPDKARKALSWRCAVLENQVRLPTTCGSTASPEAA